MDPAGMGMEQSHPIPSPAQTWQLPQSLAALPALPCQALPVPRAPHLRFGGTAASPTLGEKNIKTIKGNSCSTLKIELGRVTSRDNEGVKLLHPKGATVLFLLYNSSVPQPRCFNELILFFSTQS